MCAPCEPSPRAIRQHSKRAGTSRRDDIPTVVVVLLIVIHGEQVNLLVNGLSANSGLMRTYLVRLSCRVESSEWSENRFEANRIRE